MEKVKGSGSPDGSLQNGHGDVKYHVGNAVDSVLTVGSDGYQADWGEHFLLTT